MYKSKKHIKLRPFAQLCESIRTEIRCGKSVYMQRFIDIFNSVIAFPRQQNYLSQKSMYSI